MVIIGAKKTAQKATLATTFAFTSFLHLFVLLINHDLVKAIKYFMIETDVSLSFKVLNLFIFFLMMV